MPGIQLFLAAFALAGLLFALVPSVAISEESSADMCAQVGTDDRFRNTLDDIPEGQVRPLSTAHFLDLSGAITAADIEDQVFAETPCIGSFPITPPYSALWLRFSVANPHDGQVDWVISFMETIIDDVVLYEHTAEGRVVVAQNGRVLPGELKADAAVKTALSFSLASGQEKQFYLRLSGTFSELITPVLVTDNLFERWTIMFGAVSALLLGFTAMLAVFSVLLFRHAPSHFYKYYTLFVVSCFFFTLLFDGWFNRLFDVQYSVKTMIPLIEFAAGLGIIANVQYCRVLLSGGTMPPGQRLTLQILTGITVLSTVLVVWNPWVFALPHHLLFFLSPVVLLVLALRRLGSGLVQVPAVCAALLCFTSGLAVANYFFLFPVQISQTSSVLDLMLMWPVTFSYAFAIIGEAFFMILAISMMLHAMRQQSARALTETATLRDALAAEKIQNERALKARAAQIKVLTTTIAPDDTKAILSASDQFANRATKSVIDHIETEGFGPKDLAAELAVSEKTLGRRLQDARNLSPAAFIRSVRLQFARELILLQKLGSVTEVAHAAGFSNPRHFARLYKSEFRETPSQTIKAL